MGIFGFGKSEQKGCGCGCGSKPVEIPTMVKPEENSAQAQGIIVLGMGCAKCKELTEITKNAIESMGISSEVEHITDIATIASYGITATPALVIDGVLASSGKVLKTEEVISLIKQVRG